MNTIVAITGLQNCTDQQIYNKDNRGLANEVSLGTFGSQGFIGLLLQLEKDLPLLLTSAYDYVELVETQGKNCSYFVEQTLPNNTDICIELKWTDYTSLAMWIQPYWDGKGSESWELFKNVSKLTESQMEDLYTGELATSFAELDLSLKQHYNCTNTGNRCWGLDLAKKQLGQSYVTLNMPSSLSSLGLTNVSSVYYLPGINQSLIAEPEYPVYAKKKNLTHQTLTEDQIARMFNYDHLLGGSPLQRFFVKIFHNDLEALEKEYLVEDPVALADYIRYVVDKFVFGGLFKTKTVEELLFTEYDQMIATIVNTNPLMGGDPSQDPTSTRLGKNQTQYQWEYVPLKYRHALNTGQIDMSQVRWYRIFNGVPYINILKKAYKGQGEYGPIIEWTNYNPWAEEVQVEGGDTWNFQPDITGDSTIRFFLKEAGLTMNGKYGGRHERRGFNCYRFYIDSEVLNNATVDPSKEKFYQFGPVGVVNQTNVMGAPLFGSKPYFLDGDPQLYDNVKFTKLELANPSEYDSYFDIEHYAGGVFYVSEQLQYNAYLQPDALYPYLGQQKYQETGYQTYMPSFFMAKTEEFSQEIVDDKFGAIKTANGIKVVIQVIGYTLGGILLIALVLYQFKLRKERKMVESEASRIDASALVPEE